MFIRQAKQTSREVKQAIPFVPNRCAFPSNRAANSMQWVHLQFLRDVRHAIFATPGGRYNPFDSNIADLYDTILTALFALYGQVGACGEVSAFTILKYLSECRFESIEVIKIVNEKVADSNHVFVLLNRNANTDINDPASWGSCVLIDPWREKNNVRVCNQGSVMERDDLLNHFVTNISSIAVDIRIEGELHPQIWEQMNLFLKASQLRLNLALIENLIDEEDLSYVETYYESAPAIYKTLFQLFDHAIVAFEKLTAKALETYAQKNILADNRISYYSSLSVDTLFRLNRSTTNPSDSEKRLDVRKLGI